MDKNSIWKWIILIALTAWSISIVTPLNEKIKLGLDLRGGTRYVLQVDKTGLNDDTARDAVPRALEVIRNRVDAMGVSEPVIYTEPGDRIIVEIPGLKPEDRERALKNIQSAAYLEFRMVHPKNEELVDQLFTKGQAPTGYRIVSVADKRSGGPWDYKDYYARDKEKTPADMTEAQVRDRAKLFQAPTGFELLMNEEVQGIQRLYRPYFVEKRAQLTGESLSGAGVDYDQLMQPHVTLKFDSRGAKRFAKITGDYAPGGERNPNQNQRRQLGIVLDGTLKSAPSIKEAIFGGSAIIEGSFSVKEAQDLSIVLRAGALPAPVKLLEERTVAPTLGEESVSSGKFAATIGIGAVIVFMIVYYTIAGAIADVALIMNLILMPIGLLVTGGLFSIFAPGTGGGAMSLPTLTLPGIAGIALTIGMAVDANVLIYERMREEQQAGKRLKAVIAAGYDKAFSAIFDSNLTTLISAAILFWQGTGPVRGYAVTLSAGIIVSMYTALVVTRMVFELIATYTNVQSLKMLHILKAPNYDFLKMKGVCVTLSLLLIIGSAGLFIAKGKKNFGVDFTGGASITYTFKEKVSTDDLTRTLDGAGVAQSTIQYQQVQVNGAPEEHLEIKVASDASAKATAALAAAHPAAEFKVLKEDNVGPQIGKELQRKAIIATLLSLVGIIIYVSIRFEFPFAAGAVAALLHDVLVAVGVYCALGNQLSVTMVAAVLTIIGYSVNDTIVIFDRIRELMKLNPGRKIADVANDAMNQCLSRTLLTSFATMLTVVALLVWGGGAIKDFTLILFIGMISGVYSTIYIATPVVLMWHKSHKPAAAAAKTVPAKA